MVLFCLVGVFVRVYSAVGTNVDGDLLPGEKAWGVPAKLGDGSHRWRSINEVIFFDFSGRVGITSSSPETQLGLSGPLRLNTTDPQPTSTCTDGTIRGTFWIFQGSTSTKDVLRVCAQNGGSASDWRDLTP